MCFFIIRMLPKVANRLNPRKHNDVYFHLPIS